MATQPPFNGNGRVLEPLSGPQHFVPPTARELRAQAVQRLQAGLFGLAAIVLIVAGIIGLAYGSFSYTKETHDIKMGPIEMSVKEKETINVPVWAGVGAIAIGAALLLLALSLLPLPASLWGQGTPRAALLADLSAAGAPRPSPSR